MEQTRRNVVSELFGAGHAPKDIIAATGYSSATVYRTVARIKASGDVGRKNHRVRSDKKRTPRFLAGLKCTVLANPKVPMSKLAKKKNVSRKTIARAIKQDLGMKSYVRRRRSLLIQRLKDIRAERCPRLLTHLKHGR